MPSIDLTDSFREIVQEKQKTMPPEPKRRRIIKPSSETQQDSGSDIFGKGYITEAYIIVRALL